MVNSDKEYIDGENKNKSGIIDQDTMAGILKEMENRIQFALVRETLDMLNSLKDDKMMLTEENINLKN